MTGNVTSSASEAATEHATRFQPAGEGPAKGMPQSWRGELSGVLFASSWQGGFPVLSIFLEAEITVQINDAMRDEKTLLSQSELLDLAFKIAMDDEVRDVDIAEDALGLAYVRDFLARSHAHLTEQVATARGAMEPTAENTKRMERTERSLMCLRRISERIGARLELTLPVSVLRGIGTADAAAPMQTVH